LAVPCGSDAVVIDRGIALIDNCKVFSTVFGVASVSVKVWVASPVTVGVPLSTPLGSNDRPLGKGGELALRPHVYGVMPPVPLRAIAYGWPIDPLGSGELVRIVRGVGEALTVSERTFWTDAPLESTNLNSVKIVPVAVVGTPKIFPLAGRNARPLGNAGELGAKLQV
jgi:hypothetical protein